MNHWELFLDLERTGNYLEVQSGRRALRCPPGVGVGRPSPLFAFLARVVVDAVERLRSGRSQRRVLVVAAARTE